MLRDIHCYLLDMDGTIYLGNELIDGAKEFLDVLRREKTRALFLTNNSSKNRMNYVEKLRRLGIDATPEDIFTSGEATAMFLRKRYPNGATLFVLGTPPLMEELEHAGFAVKSTRKEGLEDVDEVVLGFDTTLTYEKLWAACDLVRAKGSYIATHPDFNCPLEGGAFMPDAGAMIAFIHASTEVMPTVIGKPEHTMVDTVLEKYGLQKKELAMVGDRLYTDIAMGEKAGITSILVFSGETTHADYDASTTRATYTFPSVKELKDAILAERKEE